MARDIQKYPGGTGGKNPVPSEKIRAFVAIHPPRKVLEQIARFLSELRQRLDTPDFRWTRIEQVHLTTEFLGYVHRDNLAAIEGAIEEAVSRHRPFQLIAESLGCFPSPARARVLWVGLKGETDALERLKTDLDQKLTPWGFQPESRPFHPHLTIARMANLPPGIRPMLQETLARNASYFAGSFQVETVELMQSVLSPQGAVYERLRALPLLKGDGK